MDPMVKPWDDGVGVESFRPKLKACRGELLVSRPAQIAHSPTTHSVVTPHLMRDLYRYMSARSALLVAKDRSGSHGRAMG
jgi:hypothetical protein